MESCEGFQDCRQGLQSGRQVPQNRGITTGPAPQLAQPRPTPNTPFSPAAHPKPPHCGLVGPLSPQGLYCSPLSPAAHPNPLPTQPRPTSNAPPTHTVALSDLSLLTFQVKFIKVKNPMNIL